MSSQHEGLSGIGVFSGFLPQARRSIRIPPDPPHSLANVLFLSHRQLDRITV